MKTELRDRLAALTVEVDTSTTERHLAATQAVLLEPPASPEPHHEGVRVLRPVAAMLLAIILLVPAMALAADDTIPGDVLYPVKRTVEWAWSHVDPDVVARHRVEELEEAVRRGASGERLDELMRDARDAVGDSGGELEGRLEQARVRLSVRDGGTQQGNGESNSVETPEDASFGRGGEDGAGVDEPAVTPGTAGPRDVSGGHSNGSGTTTTPSSVPGDGAGGQRGSPGAGSSGETSTPSPSPSGPTTTAVGSSESTSGANRGR